MPHVPDLHRFSTLADSHRLVPVYRRLFADGLTPLSAFARIDSGACGCLFESVVGGEKVGRYSFLGADPFMRLEARGAAVTIVSRDGDSETLESDDPLGELDGVDGHGSVLESREAGLVRRLRSDCLGTLGRGSRRGHGR